MSSGGEYFFNENIQVSDVRTIAVRALTPNHIGATFSAVDGYYAGTVARYRHNIDAGTSDVWLDSPVGEVHIKLQTLDLVKVFG